MASMSWGHACPPPQSCPLKALSGILERYHRQPRAWPARLIYYCVRPTDINGDQHAKTRNETKERSMRRRIHDY